jgi:hypothetical protein
MNRHSFQMLAEFRAQNKHTTNTVDIWTASPGVHGFLDKKRTDFDSVEISRQSLNLIPEDLLGLILVCGVYHDYPQNFTCVMSQQPATSI